MRHEVNNKWNNLTDLLPENIKADFINKISKNLKIEDSNENLINKKFNYYLKEEIDSPVIYIGMGTCGLAAGADKTKSAILNYLNKNKINALLLDVGCIGFCSAEPLVDIQFPGKNRLSFYNVTDDRVNYLFDNVFKNKIPDDMILGQYSSKNFNAWENKISFLENHPFFTKQKRYVLKNCGIINPESIEEYIAFGGYQAFFKAIHKLTHLEICDIVEKSELKGRGGGGFLTAQKWKIALKQGSYKRYMICNADEGDPGAFMDRALIEGDPHRLLEGLAIAAYAIHADTAFIYIRTEYPLAIKRLKTAIEDAKKYGFLGNNIYDSGFNLNVIIKEGAGAFVCGEETALIHSIEGKRGMPSPRPPFPATSGLFNQPTIINNVETLANIPEIINKGPETFNSIGTKNSKGTKVFALSGKVKRAGLVEVPMGISIREIIYDIGGGVLNDKKLKAVQIGGPSGGCIPAEYIDIEIDYISLKKLGAMMGSGGLVVIDEDNCIVDLAKYFITFIQRESCGKCIPCREGTRRIYEILNSITRHRRYEKDNDALARFQGVLELEKLSEVIKDTSLCGLGQTAANPVLSTLKWFREEYEIHVFERKCPAKNCRELLSYSIDSAKCKGCMACIKKCPTEAIIGKLKTPHYIIPDKCIGCGNCNEVCKFDAIKVE